MKKIRFFLFVLVMAALVFTLGCGAPQKDDAKEISSLEQLSQLKDIIKAEEISDLGDFYSDKICMYKIRYKSDDCEVVGYIAAPLDYLENEYPVLVFNRGGNQEFGALSHDTMAIAASKIDEDAARQTGLDVALNRAAEECTKNGYIVLASQYRGVDGGTGTEEFGGSDVNDVLKLIDISEGFLFARPGGVYMAGFSRGGMMTYIACRQDERIIAAAVGSGISNAVDNYTERDSDMKEIYVSLIGGTPEELPDEYEKRSAVLWADEINCPLLIVHGGGKDWRVLTHHASDMAQALESSGKTHKLVIYEEMDHDLGIQFWFDMDDWFAEFS